MDKNEIKTVEMTRSIRDAHYELMKDKSGEERMAFYRRKAAVLLTGAKIVTPAPSIAAAQDGVPG